MAGDFVTGDQASGMGGADKPSGAQAENTFQDNRLKQLVVMVRFKPKAAEFDTNGATSMLGGVTGAIEGAVGAVEGAMVSIPGLDLFIKEEKRESKSDREYKYHADYSGWDAVFDKAGQGLKELNPDNITEKFEFDSTDAEGREKDAQQLFDKIKGKMSAWSKYTAAIHFIGLGQGGNVANECTALMAKDSEFMSEKWFVRSIIYAATPLYKNFHLADEKVFKGKGTAVSFGNRYDLTQAAIDCFDKNEQLLKLIQDSNKNVLSLATGKVKLRIIQILSILLSGLHLSASDTGELDKFGKIKDEVEGLAGDVVDLVKKIIEEGTSFVDLGDIPEFSNVVNGYDQIPSEAVGRLKEFIDSFTRSAADQAKSANVSLSPKDLAGALNCLCPLFDKIADSIAVFKPGSPAANALSAQIIEKAGVTKVFPPAGGSMEHLPVDDEYENKARQATKPGQPETGTVYVRTVQSLLTKAAANQNDVDAMSEKEKASLAEAISCLVSPMLASKKELYAKLLNLIPFDLTKMMDNISADKLMSIPGGALQVLNIEFPAELKTSMARADGEIKRIQGYFDKKSFDPPEDTMYFVFNAHNLTLKKMYGPIANCLDQQTGYLEYMQAKGFNNEFSITDNNYKQGSGEPKTNVMPAKELPAAN